MHFSPRRVLSLPLPTVLLLVFLSMLLAVSTGPGRDRASAEDIQATPVLESEPKSEDKTTDAVPEESSRSRIRSVGPTQADAALQVEFTNPDAVYGLTSTTYAFTAAWDARKVDFGMDTDRVRIQFELDFLNTQGYAITAPNLGEFGLTGTVSFSPATAINLSASLRNDCIVNNGRIKLEMRATAVAPDLTVLYEVPSHPVDIQCSVLVIPQAPGLPAEMCGPNNDEMNIPQQPDGVLVDTGIWIDGVRVVTFSSADWAEFPDGFETEYTFTDNQPCTATATFTGPTSLYLLDADSRITLTGEFDVSSLWPEEGSLVANIQGQFLTQRINSIFRLPLPISSSAEPFSITPGFSGETLVEYCADREYDGDLVLFMTITFFRQNPTNQSVPVWVYEQTLDIPCTVLVQPALPVLGVEVCGPGNDILTIQNQPNGVSVEDSGWDGTQRTFTYSIANWVALPEGFELTHTVHDTDPPCDVDVTISAPESLPRLPGTDHWYVTVEYDLTNIWPQNLPVGTRIDIHTYGAWSLRSVEGPVGSHTQTLQWSPEFVIERCIAGEGTLSSDITFTFHINQGAHRGEVLYSVTEHVETDCTVAVYPEEASYIAEMCGYTDERLRINTDQAGISGHTITWQGNVATIEYIPLDWHEIVGGPFTVTIDEDPGNCLVTPVAPDAPVAVCGPNNDVLAMPDQPEGLTFEDSGWVNNERTIEFIPADGYALADGAQARLVYTDADIACEVDPVGTTLVLRFETSDGGSLEGESWAFYAPVASQVSADPWAEGVIGAGNTVVLEEIIAGTYRVVVDADGYQPIDETIIVTAEGASEEHMIEVLAMQPVETPTPSPTPSVEPTPTVEPTPEPTTQPSAEPTDSAVTGLPETGSGSSSPTGILLAVGLIAAMVLGIAGNRRFNR